jgi:hypothetical protein
LLTRLILQALLASTLQGAEPCRGVPGPPTSLAYLVRQDTVTLTWKAPDAVSPLQYSVETGNASGSTYLGTIDTGNALTRYTKTFGPGVYYFRVRAANACGAGPASNEVRVEVEPARIGPRTPPDVVVARRTPERNAYFPTAERLKNGDIVVVYYDSPDHVSPAGRISMVRSSDDGRSWSAPAVVVDGPRDERDPNIVETARGTLLVSFFESDPSRSPTSQGVFVMRSSDGGKTWSPPAVVATTLQGAATSAKIVQLENGDLLIPIYGGRGGSQDAVASVARSSDDGRTWSPESEATIAATPGVSFVEPAVASLGGGRLLAMVRTEGGERNAFESYSLDGGRTWSPPARTDFVAQASDLLPIPRGPNRDLLVHAWGDVSGRFGDSRATVLQFVRFREFPGARWSGEPRLLHQGHCWADEGYPSSVQISESRVLTVYYDACAGYIGGTFSTIVDPAADAPCDDAPAAPADLHETSNKAGSVSLAWTASPGKPTAYVLEAGTRPGGADVATTDVRSQTSYDALHVQPGTYYVRVRARNACGTSPPSKEAMVVVQ